MDKISVIIPVYKTEKYLNKCVESITGQTYKNLEIILVDDDSPDSCPQMCDEWAEKDGRIKVLHIENKGVANARNKALEIASGSYVAFADSDDFAEKDMIETLYRLAEKENCDIAVCGFYGGEYEAARALPAISRAEDALRLIAQGDFAFGVLWNKLYKAEVIKGVKMPPLVCCEDLVFNYFAFKNARSVCTTNEKKYHYIRHKSSTTVQRFNSGAFDAVKSKKMILDDAKGGANEKYAVKGMVNSCFVVLSGAIRAGGFDEECIRLRKIILSYKNEILKSRLYSKKDKFKALVLLFSIRLYSRIIERKL